MKTERVLLLILLSISHTARAEPVVLFDSGNTVPTYSYKQILQGVSIPDFGQLWAADKVIEIDKSSDPTDPANWLPVSTRKLSPGRVTAREVRFNQLASPVCVVGSDEKSLNWIKKYRSALLQNNVLCWLVSAENLEQVQQVVIALDGVSMSPADGDAIADFFSIAHYPVLISQRFIEQ